jgi:hypothetical protein
MNELSKKTFVCDRLCAQPATIHSLLDLGENFRVLEQVVFLRKHFMYLYRTRDEPKGEKTYIFSDFDGIATPSGQ